MMSGREAAVRFVQIVAHAQPEPGNQLDRTVVNAARKIAWQLRAEGLGDEEPPPLPASASGVPIIRRKA